ncbi:MAG: hypothetical protein R3A44_30390 [Caldilineaceae bacterium]
MKQEKYLLFGRRLAVAVLALYGWLAITSHAALAQSGVDVTANNVSVFGSAGSLPSAPITDTALVTIYDLPTVALSKQLQSTDPLQVGDPVHFAIVITNTGEITITSLTLEDRYSSVFITYDGGATSPAPSTAIDGLVTWNSLLTNGLAPDQSITVDVYFDAATDTTLLTAVAPCTMPSAAPNLARLLNMLADPDGAGPLPAVSVGDEQACASVRIFNPTGIQLGERSVLQMPNGVLARWLMVDETNVIGFNIWRSNGVNAERRNSELILTKAGGQQATGAMYEWLDVDATLSRGDAYVLEILYADGSTQRVVLDVMRTGPLFLPLIKR